MPELQLSELAYDDANSQLIAQRENIGKSTGHSGNGNENDPSFPVTMSASLRDNGREISLDYLVGEDTDASFYAYDLAGRMLGSVTHVSLGKGEYNETMVLDRRPINGVVMLAMIAGDKKRVVKVS